MPPKHRPKKNTAQLLDILARINRQLGRLGAKPLWLVEDVKDLPDYRLREIIAAGEEHIAALERATRGYLG